MLVSKERPMADDLELFLGDGTTLDGLLTL